MSTLTPLQVAAAAYAGGFRGVQVEQAVQVAHSESSWNTDASNSCCYGLWQINLQAHPQYKNRNWQNPIDNAKMAHSIYSGAGGWCTTGTPGHETCNPWQSFGNSSYQSAHGQAVIAAAQLQQELGAGKTPEEIVGATGTPGLSGGGLNVAPAVSNSFSGITAFFSHLADVNFWKRIGIGVLGAALILAGAYFMMPKQSGSYKVASQIVGNIT
jgi:hypothetical protein